LPRQAKSAIDVIAAFERARREAVTNAREAKAKEEKKTRGGVTGQNWCRGITVQ
jgi:hypothetical protein